MTNGNRFAYVRAQGFVIFPCSQRTHISPRMVNGIHSDAVAEKGASRFFPGRIDGDDGDCLLGEMMNISSNDFVSYRRFSCTTCTGNAKYWRLMGRFFSLGFFSPFPVFRNCNRMSHADDVLPFSKRKMWMIFFWQAIFLLCLSLFSCMRRFGFLFFISIPARLQQIIDHAFQSHSSSII